MRPVHIQAFGTTFDWLNGRVVVFKAPEEYNIYEAMQRQKRRVLAGEDLAVKRMAGAWLVAQKGIQAKLDAVVSKIEAAQAAGLNVSPAWLYQQDRYQNFLVEIHDQVAKYSTQASAIAHEMQSNSFGQGGIDAKTLVATAGVKTGFKMLPKSAFDEMVGALTDKSPLHDLFKVLAPDAVAKARQVFAVEMANGSNPNVIARELRSSIDLTERRSVLIARTESMRAYTVAQRANYEANSDVVVASRWMSARDDLTCALCWAKDGEIIEHDAMFGTHPGCRCALAPVVKYVDEPKPNGEEVLAQRELDQPGYALSVLGPSRYALWKSGQIALRDLVEDVDHPRWGRGIRAKNLQQISQDISNGLTNVPVATVSNTKGFVAGSVPMPDLMAIDPKYLAAQTSVSAPPAVDTAPKTKNEYIDAMIAGMADGTVDHLTPEMLEAAANLAYPKAKAWDPEKHIVPKYKKAGVDVLPPVEQIAIAPVVPDKPKAFDPLSVPPPYSAKTTATDYTKWLIKNQGAQLSPDQVVKAVKYYFPSYGATESSVMHHYAALGVVPVGGFPEGYQYTPILKPKQKKESPAVVVDPVDQPKTVADVIMGTQIGGQRGSNPGGTYLGTDGIQRYVKFYSDADQAYGEHLANELYRRLGIASPKSTLFELNGQIAYASELLPTTGTVGEVGLTKDIAEKILQGFAADILTANWDAVGTGLDNVVVLADGSIARIDAGGTFLFRAKHGKKDSSTLDDISEWSGFAPKGVNPYYAQVFDKAGLSGPDDMMPAVKVQVAAIKQLRDTLGGWESYVRANTPGMNAIAQKKIADMLEARTNLLIAKVSQVEPKPPKAAKGAKGGIEPSKWNGVVLSSHALDALRKRLFGPLWMTKWTHAMINSLTNYKGSGYVAMNNWLRSGETEYASDQVKRDVANIRKMFKVAPAIDQDILQYRGVRGVKVKEWAQLKPGDEGAILDDLSFLSTSSSEGVSLRFAGHGYSEYSVLLKIKIPAGTKMICASNPEYPDGEKELILDQAHYRVTRIERIQKGNYYTNVLDVELIDTQEGTKEWIRKFK